MKSVFLKPTAPKELQNIITTITPKLSSGMDDIPSKIVKFTAYDILQVLSYIFNMSLELGKFIESFKIAKVVPIHKKGDRKNISTIGQLVCCLISQSSWKK